MLGRDLLRELFGLVVGVGFEIDTMLALWFSKDFS